MRGLEERVEALRGSKHPRIPDGEAKAAEVEKAVDPTDEPSSDGLEDLGTSMEVKDERSISTQRVCHLANCPYEIRQKIWYLVMPPSFYVRTLPGHLYASNLWCLRIPKEYTFQGNPIILQICSESRQEVLRRYVHLEAGYMAS